VIRDYVEVIAEVAATLEPGTEDITEREEKFEALIDQFEQTDDPIRITFNRGYTRSLMHANTSPSRSLE
jgi:4-hydroxy-3-methylbut-2-en-1-yl diphosphate synthase IspG/GcpE